jgi:hypothetical protein
MEMFSHMLFFYSNIPASIDEIVARKGLYFHMNTFYKGATTIIGTEALPGVSQINLTFCAINSVHFVFVYSDYNSNTAARKLHFVSHNLEKLQI